MIFLIFPSWSSFFNFKYISKALRYRYGNICLHNAAVIFILHISLKMNCSHPLISHYHFVNLSDSKYNTKCYLKVDGNSLNNDTAYCYSPIESIIAGVGASFQSIAGVILNLLVIIALLRTGSVRKEYITPSIISLAGTDLLYSVFTLPMMAVRYFIGYV